MSLIPPEHPGHILVVSDGHWTGRDPNAVTARAAGRAAPGRSAAARCGAATAQDTPQQRSIFGLLENFAWGKPKPPKTTIEAIINHTRISDKSAQNNMETIATIAINTPPIVGVPIFFII